MADSAETWVYRAVNPDAVSSITGRANRAAFALRVNESELSVYSAEVQTPRGALQRLIDQLEEAYNAKPEEERARFRAWMERKGTTVERRLALGWRIVRLPLSAFLERGFIAGEVEPDGHISIEGPREEFEDYAREFVLLAQVLTPEEVIAETVRKAGK